MINILAIAIGVLGAAFGARCYLELWRWARQCQNARIAVAHKGRVQLTAPLTEWLAWANQLANDEKSKGRVVYRNGHVSVAILRPTASARIPNVIRHVTRARRKTTADA